MAQLGTSTQRRVGGRAQRAGQHRAGGRRDVGGRGIAVPGARDADAERLAQLRVGRDVRRAGGAGDRGTVLEPLVADRGRRRAPPGRGGPQRGPDLGEPADARARGETQRSSRKWTKPLGQPPPERVIRVQEKSPFQLSCDSTTSFAEITFST